MDNHQLEVFDMLLRAVKLVKGHSMKEIRGTEMELVLFYICISTHSIADTLTSQYVSVLIDLLNSCILFHRRYIEMCVCIPEFITYLTRLQLMDIQIVFKCFPITNNAAVCMFILW